MPALERLLQWYADLSPLSLGTIGRHYHADAHFKDPFNDVRGVAAIERVFAHMFETVENPAFEVLEVLSQGERAFVTWNLRVGRPPRRLCLHGATHLRLDAQGLVIEQRDYWDTTEELWLQVPVIRLGVKFLRARMRAR